MQKRKSCSHTSRQISHVSQKHMLQIDQQIIGYAVKSTDLTLIDIQ